ncbi:MAG: indole-3-glycerol phosphate synthase TrpC [Bacteroidota bacterium]
MNILDRIVEHKRKEVEQKKMLYPIKLLEQSKFFASDCVSLKKYLVNPEKSGVIAEIKLKSPSKGIINEFVDIEKLSIGYMQAGASALSVLTDQEFFMGKNENLSIARKFNYCPILRKDFIINEYQIIEAKSIGADAILLIAAILSKEEIQSFTALAHAHKMEVLFEVHHESELDKLDDTIDLLGVNNRNLENFEVDIRTSEAIAQKVQGDFTFVSESGISDVESIHHLRKCGFDGFLIGEHFMRHPSPHLACADFIKQLKKRNEGESVRA